MTAIRRNLPFNFVATPFKDFDNVAT